MLADADVLEAEGEEVKEGEKSREGRMEDGREGEISPGNMCGGGLEGK